MKKTSNYIYMINEVIKDEKRNLKIIDKVMLSRKSNPVKGYKYECQNCGNIDFMNEYNLKNGCGCNVCCISPTKIIKEINSVWNTNPELLKYFKYIHDSFIVSVGSHSKVTLICPKCGNERNDICVYTLAARGFICPKCGDGFSYSEKFIFNILEQLDVEFKNHVKFEWSENLQYDFLILNTDKKEIIIEANGEQHYKGGFATKQYKSSKLKQQKDIDLYKKMLAEKNGIETYIEIDCRISNADYIKNSILNSKLTSVFDFSFINWTKCELFACSSLVEVTCNLFNNGFTTPLAIANKMNISIVTARKYLKIGNKLAWCKYSPIECITASNRRNAHMKNKKVICITTDEIFNSITSASQYYNISVSKISSCCNGVQNYAGKLNNKIPLVWTFYNEYIKMNKDDIKTDLME